VVAAGVGRAPEWSRQYPGRGFTTTPSAPICIGASGFMHPVASREWLGHTPIVPAAVPCRTAGKKVPPPVKPPSGVRQQFMVSAVPSWCTFSPLRAAMAAE